MISFLFLLFPIMRLGGKVVHCKENIASLRFLFSFISEALEEGRVLIDQ